MKELQENQKQDVLETEKFQVQEVDDSARRSLAEEFYKASFGDNAEGGDIRIASELRGINFSREVEVVSLKEGDIVVQYRRETEQVGDNARGNYFVEPGEDPSRLGIAGESKLGQWRCTPDFFLVTRDVEVLKSTAASVESFYQTHRDEAGHIVVQDKSGVWVKNLDSTGEAVQEAGKGEWVKQGDWGKSVEELPQVVPAEGKVTAITHCELLYGGGTQYFSSESDAFERVVDYGRVQDDH